MRRSCFVMTLFADKFTRLYDEVIARPCDVRTSSGRRLSYEPGSIPAQIDRDITLRVAIAVLTDGNWNVAYEMGIAHKAKYLSSH